MPRSLRLPPPRAEQAPPALAALAVQGLAATLAALAVLAGVDMTIAQWALVQGVLAWRFALLSGAALWWPPIHLVFAPGVVGLHALALPPHWYLACFLIAVLVYWSSFRTQVPLFLTGAGIKHALVELLPARTGAKVMDLGCGLGGVLAHLARVRPDVAYAGVELAPLPYLICRVRALLLPAACAIRRVDLMQVDLAPYEVVYAYLSPVPMPALWRKARAEMRPGSLFVSLAFPVPGMKASRVIALSSADRHTLYVYRM